jgi:uncharacterized protein (TIGR03435 family)
MGDLAVALQSLTGRPVVDRTTLGGMFDMELRWTPDVEARDPRAAGGPAPDDGPSIFTALQEQLGLKLDSGRGSTEVLVVDAVNRPEPD